MKKALITGGAGYIGHHLQKELKKNGYYVIVMDIKNPTELLSQKYCDRYIQADITSYGDMRERIDIDDMFVDEDLSFDIVFHLAGLIEVAESEKEPLRYYEHNVIGTFNILKLMKSYSCDKIVFSSSAGVYNEYGEIDPQSVYGKTKLMSEEIIRSSLKEGVKSVSLRYFNVAGADLDGEFGENHENESHLIPNILKNNRFTVFGTDYATPDGTCVRDYIHVSDLAAAHIKAAEWLDHNEYSEFFDIGSGIGYSIRDVISTIESVTGQKIDTTYGDRRSGDPARLFCETESAKTILGFKPIYELKDIIQTAYNWEVIQRRKPL